MRTHRLAHGRAFAHLVLLGAFLSLFPEVASSGPVTVDPANRRWLYRDGAPLYWCGPGDPEDFFYRGTKNADGTRNGDQDGIIQKLIGTGANTLWMTAVLSHGGDGDATQNPFVNHDPAQGVNTAVINQWARWIEALDAAGIVTFFVFYDDGTLVWNTGSTVGPAETSFIQTLVNRFEHVDNIVWCIGEEYQEAFNVPRVSSLATIVAQADGPGHPVSTHQTPGVSFDFANDTNHNSFAMQAAEGQTPGSLHDKVVQAWQNADGRYNVNMSESVGHYTDRTAARKLSWAAAMGGGYVMVQAMDVINTPIEALRDCGRLASFFQSTQFHLMAPNDALKRAQTEYVYGAPAAGYIVYSSNVTGSLGLAMPAAGSETCNLTWMDCASGAIVTQTGVAVPAGDNTWPKPSGFGNEVALSLRKTGGATGVESGLAPSSWGRIKSNFRR